MKKIYILTAVFALLTLSLNAQTTSTTKKAMYGPTPTDKVDTHQNGMKAPSRTIINVTDHITASALTATNTTYSNFSGVTFTSDAVYAGNSARNNGTNIQLRATNPSGIVTTTSGGKVKSITITVASGSNQIRVYGKNTAYSSGADLYSNTTRGTQLGSLTSTGTITVTDDYQYIGIRSNSGTVYISSIDVVWEKEIQIHELGIALDAPTAIGAGSTATLTATVTNNGDFAESGYTVSFYADGTLISTQVGGSLAIGANGTFTFDYPTTAAQSGQAVNFTATVACTGDAEASNNNAIASTSVITLPPPENVAATANDNSGTMTWDAPSNTLTAPVWATEGFEDTNVFPPFSAGGITETQHTGAFGDWTLYDATNGSNVYGSSELNFDHESEPHAWFVFKPSEATADPEYPDATPHPVHSGAQYLESICPTSGSAAGGLSDHWLISPELSGNAQTITFYDSELTTIWGTETYEIWVSSTNNTAPSSFTKLGETYEVNYNTWEKRSVQLPAGTKYFAIRHTSDDIFGLLVDDVTYQVNNEFAPVSYNIYLDGQFVDNVSANTFSYTFNNVSGEHECAVSAVYDFGESEAVPATFSTQPKTDTPSLNMVDNGDGTYTITATGNGTVTLTVDGYEPATGNGSASVTIPQSETVQNVTATATAQENGKLESDPATQSFTIPALPKTATPTISYTDNGDGTYTVTATGDGNVSLTVFGQTVTGDGSASITIVRAVEDQNVTATATAQESGKLASDVATENFTLPALAGDHTTAQDGLLRMHLLVVDQFKEQIPNDNSHPDRYGYVLKYEPNGSNGEGLKESGTVEVDIQKTEAQVNGYYTLSQVEADTDHDNSEITLDVLTADVGMYLPGENPDVLYYEMQGKKDANPTLGQDYLTQLQYMKNVQKYEEMLATSPNKTHQYPANETYHYFDESTPIVTGEYGVNFMTYAPSVSTWGIQRRYYEDDGLDNTYGAPIWKTGVGQVRVISTEAQLQRGPQGSTQWDGVGGPCSLVFLGLEAYGDLPNTEISNILYEPYMFRVWIQSPGNNLRGCTLIGEHVDPDKPGEHWDGDGRCYGAEPVLVYESLTTDGHLYKHVQSMEEGNNVEWGEKIQFGALDSGINDLIVYIRFYYRSTGQGVSGTRFTLRGNRDGDDDDAPEVPGYYASEGDDNPDITTGINGVYYDLNNKPVESVTYVNSQGMTSDKPFDGVNIVVTRYTDGTTRTTKVVR